MEAAHNPENAGTAPAYPYGFGHYVNGAFRTIMSYGDPCPNGCRRVAHFSNPNIRFNDEPTGVADSRDNHRVFNNKAVIVANFRVPLPGVPANVQASDGTYSDRVRITWIRVDRAERYTVYRATSATATKEVLTGSATSTSFDDTTAVPGTIYVYWVRASNALGMSDYSSSDTGYRRITPPAPPTGVSATDGLYADRVEITWSPVSGATSDSVYRATTSTGTRTLLASGRTSTLFNDTTAVAGTLYYYWIRASNSAGTSDYSASNTGYRRIASLSAPTGVSATDGTYTDRVRITWNAVSRATRYLVYRATSSTGTRTVLTTNVSETGFNDTTAVPGTVYYYWVRASVEWDEYE